MFYDMTQTGRITRALDNLRERFYIHLTDLHCEVYTSDEPLPYARRTDGVFREMRKGESFGDRLFSCGWFHVTGSVPPHGADAVIRLDVSGEALAYDAAGEPLIGLTNVRSVFDIYYGYCLAKREIPLEACLNADGAVDFWVDAGCNDLYGGNADKGVLALAEIADTNEAAIALYYDMEVLYDLQKTLEPGSAYARRLFRVLYNTAQKLTAYSAEEIEAARRALAPYLTNRNGYTPVTLTAIGHAHLDLAWLWPERETVRKGARTVATALRMMERFPDYIFGASQAQLYQWIKERYPTLYAGIRQRVAEGRWDVQGAMWVEPDTNLVCGEALIRQILYGKAFFREEFGKDIQVLWLPDVFGYTAAFPQILKKCGVPYFFTNKLYFNKNTFPHQTFVWQGIDGSEVLAHLTPTGTYGSTLGAEDLKRSQDAYRDADLSDEAIILYGVSDGGGGPGREHLERLRRVRDLYGHPRVNPGLSADFFRRLEEKRDTYAKWRGELYFEIHQGTYTTQGRIKRFNRLAEQAIRECEILSSIAARETGFPYPAAALERIWKRILFLQFHDILPGSSIGRVYAEAEAEYPRLLNELAQLSARAAATLQGGWVNLTSVLQEGFIKQNDRWMAYRALPFSRAEITETDKMLTGMENEYLRLTFARDGSLISVYDKEYQREVLRSGTVGNRLELYNDEGDAWELATDYRQCPRETLHAVSVEYVSDGPVSRMCSTYLHGETVICQDVVLTAGSREIRFETRADWHESKKTLRAVFDTSVLCDEAVCGIQFGEIRRPTHSNTSWDSAKYEVCAGRYVDQSEAGYGVAMLSDCKFGYNVKDGALDLCLLRSPYWPDGTADQGEHTFTYALFPHGGNTASGGVAQQAERLNRPLCHLEGSGATLDGYIRLSAPQIITETLKRAEDGNGYILRLFEAEGRTTDTVLSVKNMISCILTDMLGQPERELTVRDGAVSLRFAPYEIHTLRFR